MQRENSTANTNLEIELARELTRNQNEGVLRHFGIRSIAAAIYERLKNWRRSFASFVFFL